MIPKSVVELTINVFKNGLKELEYVKKRVGFSVGRGYQEPNYMSSVRNNIDTYELLIKEYEKYLEENYGDVEPIPPIPSKLDLRKVGLYEC